ncbi:MAG: hypothetical protein Q4D48_09075 [Coriobacteriales bacterium]|jgi:hypothetical protein|nr:hypothetical protein [Coriobacteriales bacterium]
MLRQRDRFERSDVPTPSAFRNTIAAAILALCAVACLLLWNVCWRKANQMNNLNSDELFDALYDQLSPTEPSAGRKWSDASFSNVQLFIVDDVNAEKPQLLGAQIFVRNTDTNECTIVNLPLNAKVWLSEGVSSLPVQFEQGGAAQALPPLTNATNVHVSHVIVATDRIWDQLARFKGPSAKALFTSQTNDFATIASDYSTGQLIKFGEMLQEIGFDNINHIDAPYWDDTLADGTAVSVIDWQELPTQLGIFEWPPAE